MQKVHKGLSIAIILAETSHVFCCVLPTVVSVVSLLSGLGLVGALPAGILQFHEFMHAWEFPVITVSGIIILLGWAAYAYSVKLDCHDTGCGHGPCEPKKKKSGRLLIVASVLFFVNVAIYVAFHRGMDTHFNVVGDTVVEAENNHEH